MSVPNNPTITEIVTEGLKKAGDSDPESTLITRAENNWMEEIKNIIRFESPKLAYLQVTSIGVLNKGQSRYAYPTDFGSDLSIVLLDGGASGVAQSGSSGVIRLAASDNSTLGGIQGKDILITSGIGQGSLSQITGFDESTKDVTVTPSFTTAPSTSSGYLIIDREIPVEQRPVFEYDSGRNATLSQPNKFYPMGDEDYGEFILNCPPDKSYGARLRYYASLQRLDLNSTLMSTLYARWRAIFVDGIYVKRLQEMDETRYENEYPKWMSNLKAIIQRETYGKDLSYLRDRVTDYA